MNNEIDKLFEAYKRPDDYKDLLNIFIENDNINVNVTKNGITPLQVGSENGNIEVVNILLLKGVDINFGEMGNTALIIAFKNGHYKEKDNWIEKCTGR